MTEEETYQFADVMLEKAERGHGFTRDGRYHWNPGDREEAFRNLILNIIADTDLVVSGKVPLERWLEAE